MEEQSELTEQQIISQYQAIMSECRNLVTKIAELEGELNEHTIVANNLQTLDPTRKGYRSVGGALIEGTVETILPVVETNRDQISLLIQNLKSTLDTKDATAREMKVKYGIRTQSEQQALMREQETKGQDESKESSSRNAGILA